MKKAYGFTLVEIMVVIVILGVLAAVAVPKLFGMVAKAKVAEIQAAAGTYIHAQDAYLLAHNAIGNWKDVGYAPPSSNVFEYSGCVQEKVPPQEGKTLIGLIASNNIKLNDCEINGSWTVAMTPQGEHHLSYEHIASPAKCASLTPNWKGGTLASRNCPATESTTPSDPEPAPAEQP